MTEVGLYAFALYWWLGPDAYGRLAWIFNGFSGAAVDLVYDQDWFTLTVCDDAEAL